MCSLPSAEIHIVLEHGSFVKSGVGNSTFFGQAPTLVCSSNRYCNSRGVSAEIPHSSVHWFIQVQRTHVGRKPLFSDRVGV